MIGINKNELEQYMNLGICPTMLMPESFKCDKAHLAAVKMGSELDNYTALDLYLTEDSSIAQEEIKILRNSGKIINYNSPAQFQLPGAYDAGSEDMSSRNNAYDLVRRHLDYAAELECKLFVVTSCPDDPLRRNDIGKYFYDFTQKTCVYAKERNIKVVIEPIERHRFKKLFLGPTSEVVEFVRHLQENGCDNLSVMIDFGHLPLMEETAKEAVDLSMRVGLGHVHFGDAVLNPANPLCGHMHPAMCEREGSYSMEDISEQLMELFRCGYLKKTAEEKPFVSLEVRPYAGVSAKTSAQVHYERMRSAMDKVLEQLSL